MQPVVALLVKDALKLVECSLVDMLTLMADALNDVPESLSWMKV